MSRIRSIHPGLWTDEAFVSLSPMARLLIMGIWNECDDTGSFAWAPLTLKMRVLPADNVDASELLAEMVGAGIVMRYEIAGKSYGAVRNFCQYQRPKKPNSVFPQTDEVREWVNAEARSTRDGGEPVPNQLPTDGENCRQMEDGGDKGREVSEPKGSSPHIDSPEILEGKKRAVGACLEAAYPAEDPESDVGLELKPEHLAEAWNDGPAKRGAVVARRLSPQRRRKVIQFLRKWPVDDITEAIGAVQKSRFLCGQTREEFRADIEFLFSETHMNRLLEGFYG